MRRGLQGKAGPWQVIIGCVALLSAWAQAASPTPDELNEVRARLTRARQSLTSPDLPLEGDKHQSLRARLDEADAAFQRYLKLSKQGETRARLQAPLALAGVALVADDATGIGVADDPLLPLIGLGLVASQMLTQAPVPATEIEEAWREVLRKMQAVADEARQLGASSRYIQPPRALPGFPNALPERKLKTPIPGASGKLRRRWREGQRILEWDYQHGRVEMYDHKGRHLGEFDANTGEQLKEPVPGRKIEP